MGAFKWWTSPPSSRSRADRGRALVGSCLVLTLGLPWLAPPALALPNDACIKDERCKEHHDKAVNYYSQQYYEEALSEFQAAYAARQMPLLLINIGRTLQKLGRPKEALSYYERFQQAEANPDPAIQAKLSEYMTQVKALIGSQPSSAPTEQTGTAARPSLTTQTTTTGNAVTPPAPGRNLIIAGGALAGVGVLGLITGVGLYAKSNSDYGTFMQSSDELDQLAAKNSAQAFGIGSTASYVVGVVFVGAGATLIALGARKLLAHRRAAATPAPAPAPASPAATPAPSAALLSGPGAAQAAFTGAF